MTKSEQYQASGKEILRSRGVVPHRTDDAELCLALRFVPECAGLPMCAKAADRIEQLGDTFAALTELVRKLDASDGGWLVSESVRAALAKAVE